jgi:hypothetical protein
MSIAPPEELHAGSLGSVPGGSLILYRWATRDSPPVQIEFLEAESPSLRCAGTLQCHLPTEPSLFDAIVQAAVEWSSGVLVLSFGMPPVGIRYSGTYDDGEEMEWDIQGHPILYPEYATLHFEPPVNLVRAGNDI